MSIQTQKSDDGNTLTIAIDGRFDFSKHKEFRGTYQNEGAANTFVVDLSKAEYLDSSALGMLLLLKKHVDGGGGSVVIKQPQDEVAKVLSIANFDKIFDIR